MDLQNKLQLKSKILETCKSKYSEIEESFIQIALAE